jgi:hypothetical protein
MGEVVGVIIVFVGLFATLILWATSGRAEGHNPSEDEI